YSPKRSNTGSHAQWRAILTRPVAQAPVAHRIRVPRLTVTGTLSGVLKDFVRRRQWTCPAEEGARATKTIARAGSVRSARRVRPRTLAGPPRKAGNAGSDKQQCPGLGHRGQGL